MTDRGNSSGVPGRVASGALRSLLLAGAAAILPVMALSPMPVAATTPAQSAFLAPAEPMVLTRVLRRPLPGGIEIATTRSYEIRFVRENGGFRIEGDLIAVAIEAPRQFEALAALERSRPDTGMFPMRIDETGRFVAAQAPPPPPAAPEVEHIAQGLVPASLSPTEAHDASAFISQTAASPIRTAWPDDLFRPTPGKRSSSQVIALPGGKTGEVTVAIEASIDPGSGLVATLEREVTTRLGDSTRVTIETWTLSPKG